MWSSKGSSSVRRPRLLLRPLRTRATAMAAAATLVSSHRHRSPPQTTVARPPSPSAHTIPCAPTADDPTVSGPLLLPTPDNSNVVAQGQRVRRRAERLLVRDNSRGGQVHCALQRQEHHPRASPSPPPLLTRQRMSSKAVERGEGTDRRDLCSSTSQTEESSSNVNR